MLYAKIGAIIVHDCNRKQLGRSRPSTSSAAARAAAQQELAAWRATTSLDYAVT
jgi:hypothetical protein